MVKTVERIIELINNLSFIDKGFYFILFLFAIVFCTFILSVCLIIWDKIGFIIRVISEDFIYGLGILWGVIKKILKFWWIITRSPLKIIGLLLNTIKFLLLSLCRRFYRYTIRKLVYMGLIREEWIYDYYESIAYKPKEKRKIEGRCEKYIDSIFPDYWRIRPPFSVSFIWGFTFRWLRTISFLIYYSIIFIIRNTLSSILGVKISESILFSIYFFSRIIIKGINVIFYKIIWWGYLLLKRQLYYIIPNWAIFHSLHNSNLDWYEIQFIENLDSEDESTPDDIFIKNPSPKFIHLLDKYMPPYYIAQDNGFSHLYINPVKKSYNIFNILIIVLMFIFFYLPLLFFIAIIEGVIKGLVKTNLLFCKFYKYLLRIEFNILNSILNIGEYRIIKILLWPFNFFFINILRILFKGLYNFYKNYIKILPEFLLNLWKGVLSILFYAVYGVVWVLYNSPKIIFYLLINSIKIIFSHRLSILLIITTSIILYEQYTNIIWWISCIIKSSLYDLLESVFYNFKKSWIPTKVFYWPEFYWMAPIHDIFYYKSYNLEKTHIAFTPYYQLSTDLAIYKGNNIHWTTKLGAKGTKIHMDVFESSFTPYWWDYIMLGYFEKKYRWYGENKEQFWRYFTKVLSYLSVGRSWNYFYNWWIADTKIKMTGLYETTTYPYLYQPGVLKPYKGVKEVSIPWWKKIIWWFKPELLIEGRLQKLKANRLQTEKIPPLWSFNYTYNTIDSGFVFNLPHKRGGLLFENIDSSVREFYETATRLIWFARTQLTDLEIRIRVWEEVFSSNTEWMIRWYMRYTNPFIWLTLRLNYIFYSLLKEHLWRKEVYWILYGYYNVDFRNYLLIAFAQQLCIIYPYKWLWIIWYNLNYINPWLLKIIQFILFIIVQFFIYGKVIFIYSKEVFIYSKELILNSPPVTYIIAPIIKARLNAMINFFPSIIGILGVYIDFLLFMDRVYPDLKHLSWMYHFYYYVSLDLYIEYIYYKYIVYEWYFSHVIYGYIDLVVNAHIEFYNYWGFDNKELAGYYISQPLKKREAKSFFFNKELLDLSTIMPFWPQLMKKLLKDNSIRNFLLVSCWDYIATILELIGHFLINWEGVNSNRKGNIFIDRWYNIINPHGLGFILYSKIQYYFDTLAINLQYPRRLGKHESQSTWRKGDFVPFVDMYFQYRRRPIGSTLHWRVINLHTYIEFLGASHYKTPWWEKIPYNKGTDSYNIMIIAPKVAHMISLFGLGSYYILFIGFILISENFRRLVFCINDNPERGTIYSREYCWQQFRMDDPKNLEFFFIDSKTAEKIEKYIPLSNKDSLKLKYYKNLLLRDYPILVDHDKIKNVLKELDLAAIKKDHLYLSPMFIEILFGKEYATFKSNWDQGKKNWNLFVAYAYSKNEWIHKAQYGIEPEDGYRNLHEGYTYYNSYIKLHLEKTKQLLFLLEQFDKLYFNNKLSNWIWSKEPYNMRIIESKVNAIKGDYQYDYESDEEEIISAPWALIGWVLVIPIVLIIYPLVKMGGWGMRVDKAVEYFIMQPVHHRLLTIINHSDILRYLWIMSSPNSMEEKLIGSFASKDLENFWHYKPTNKFYRNFYHTKVNYLEMGAKMQQEGRLNRWKILHIEFWWDSSWEGLRIFYWLNIGVIVFILLFGRTIGKKNNKTALNESLNYHYIKTFFAIKKNLQNSYLWFWR